jgi:hypothetical protein
MTFEIDTDKSIHRKYNSFKNQFDFYTDDLKKYLPKIKLVLKYEMTFEIDTDKSIHRKYN